MKLFFDTSALVKLFHKEPGTDAVTKWIQAAENEIWIFALARLEFFSALFRRFRNSEISEALLQEAIMGFEEQVAMFNIQPLSQVVLEHAELLIKDYGKTHGLRSLDSLHLSAFLLISEADWVFVSADSTLCKVTSLLGYNTLNPLEK